MNSQPENPRKKIVRKVAGTEAKGTGRKQKTTRSAPGQLSARTAVAVGEALRAKINHEKAAHYPKFFKAGPGEYAEGDRFLGVVVPDQRKIARQFRDLPIQESRRLLTSDWHEERLTALFILVGQYQKGDEKIRKSIYELYTRHFQHVNNWDLVDSSAHLIVGPYLKTEDRIILRKWARSKHLWTRRIAMMATFHYIKRSEFGDALDIARILIDDPHDLIHKAVGWMLREIGNRHLPTEEAFLRENGRYRQMPRTMLRYAIEKFPENLRQAYLKGEI